MEDRCRRRAWPRFSPNDWLEIHEDLKAEVCSRLLRAFARPNFLLRNPVAYVNRVIDARCADHYRLLGNARRVRELDSAVDVPADPRGPERMAAKLDALRALKLVGQDWRRRLIQKYVLGLSLEEMAEREGISPQAMCSRLHASRCRARAQLSHSRELIAAEPPGS